MVGRYGLPSNTRRLLKRFEVDSGTEVLVQTGLHGACADIPPLEFEANYLRGLDEASQ